jgi:DNA mismatch repair protein MutL
MANEIVVLPDALTDRIAAGEVVERPASIVKELLENALDAGATEVSVALENGGCQAIRVTDNGAGIDGEQVPLAFTRFATSKIRAFEDLYRIRSFGFRGEALPSIASIARVEMVTRRADSPAGTRVIIEAGELKEMTDAGCPVGTTILVDRIFAPVPVRRKFLKAQATEQGYCLDVITRLALAQPGIRLRVTAGERTLLALPAVQGLAERIALTLGRDLQEQLLPVTGEKGGATLAGFVSRPVYTRSNAAQIYLYVNGRFVKDYLLNHAVMTAYRRTIEPRRYPAAVLRLEVPAEDLDVNVHPTKLEVRFRDPREIYALIVESLGCVIGAGISPTGQSEPAGGPAAGQTVYRSRVEEALKRYRISGGQEKLFFGGGSSGKAGVFPSSSGPPSPEPFPPPPDRSLPETSGEAMPSRPRFADRSYLGEVAGTYLLFTGSDGLWLVDQHAAHERILFERLKRTAERDGGRAPGQRLLLPEVVSLAPRDFAFISEAIPILAETGMEVEPFGGDSVVVKTLPTSLPPLEAQQLLRDLLVDCGETDRRLPLQERRERILTSLACRGAVKARHALSGPEVAALCRDLDDLPQTLTCPHGRPLAVCLTVAELEKWFKRR